MSTFFEKHACQPAASSDEQHAGGSTGSMEARHRDASVEAEESLNFSELYRAHVETIYKFAYLRVGSRAAAEDVTSTVFLKALRSLHRYRGDRHRISAWLLAIARNTLIDLQRAARPSVTDDVLDNKPDEALSPDEAVITDERSRELRRALAQLPDDQRLAIELQLAGQTLAESAVALDRSVGAVKKLRARAIRNLRKQLPRILE